MRAFVIAALVMLASAAGAQAQQNTAEAVGKELNVKFEDLSARNDSANVSAAVRVLQTMYDASSPDFVTKLKAQWPAIRSNPAIRQPLIGPQAVFDILSIDKMLTLKPEYREAAPDASISLAVDIYKRWSDTVLKRLRLDGLRVAKTGVVPYPTLRDMLRIDKNRQIIGEGSNSWLEEVRNIVEVAWNNGAKPKGCELSEAEYRRGIALSRDLAVLGSNVGQDFLKTGGIRFLQTEGKRNPNRPELINVANLLGLNGLATQLQNGKIEDEVIDLAVVPSSASVRKSGTTPVVVTALGCGRKPLAKRAVTLSIEGLDGATLTPTTAETDSMGRVKALFTAPDALGTASVHASMSFVDPESGARMAHRGDATISVITSPIALGTVEFSFMREWSRKNNCDHSSGTKRFGGVFKVVLEGNRTYGWEANGTGTASGFDNSDAFFVSCSDGTVCQIATNIDAKTQSLRPTITVRPKDGSDVALLSISLTNLDAVQNATISCEGRAADMLRPALTPTPHKAVQLSMEPYAWTNLAEVPLNPPNGVWTGTTTKTGANGEKITISWNLRKPN